MQNGADGGRDVSHRRCIEYCTRTRRFVGRDHARLLKREYCTLRCVEFDRKRDESEEDEGRKQNDAGPNHVRALQPEPNPRNEGGDVRADHRRFDDQRAEVERPIVLRVLNGVASLVRRDPKRRQRTPPIHIGRKPQNARTRIVVVGKKPGRLFDTNSADATLSNEFTSRFSSRPAAAARHPTVLVERRLDPRARPKTEQDAGDEKCEIERVEMKHFCQPKSELGPGKGRMDRLGSSVFAPIFLSILYAAGCTQVPPPEASDKGRAASGPGAGSAQRSESEGPDAASQKPTAQVEKDSPDEEKSDAPKARPLPTISKTLPAAFDCSGHTCYRFEDSRQALVPVILQHKAQLIAFGEAHAPAGFKGTTTVGRFTRDLLPTIADGASHLLLELLNPPKEGCQKEKQAAQKESNQITQGQAQQNQNEYLVLGAETRKLGVVPDILWSTCEDLAYIASPEGGVVAMMETIAKLSEKSLKEQLRTTRKGRPLVLAYGGALHNDATPKEGRTTWSYGPAMLEDTKGSYLEIDLIVPELISDSESWKSFAWYDAYQALDHKEGAVLMQWGEHSYSLFLEPGL